jgi:DNA-binding response OmpR family regulator
MDEPKALIIDDEPDVATYLATVLTDNGWKTFIAHGADAGLDLARSQEPKLILLDVMMPERGGMSTLVALRKEKGLEGVPIILVTAIQSHLRKADFKAFLDRAYAYGPDGYLEKPVKPEVLMEMVNRVTAEAAVG